MINELTLLPRHYTHADMKAAVERDRKVRVDGNARTYRSDAPDGGEFAPCQITCRERRFADTSAPPCRPIGASRVDRPAPPYAFDGMRVATSRW